MDKKIEVVTCDNPDFIKLCSKLDDFQNEIFPERKNLDMSALYGLDKLEIIYMIYDGDKGVACGGLKPVNLESVELSRMYTEEEYRGLGLAKIIMEKIFEYAKLHGYKKIILDTWVKSESARKLYTSMGFRERGSFDSKKFKNSFSTYDDTIQGIIEDKLVFMEKEI